MPTPQYGSLAPPSDRPGSTGPLLVAKPHGKRAAVGHAGLAHGGLDVMLHCRCAQPERERDLRVAPKKATPMGTIGADPTPADEDRATPATMAKVAPIRNPIRARALAGWGPLSGSAASYEP